MASPTILSSVVNELRAFAPFSEIPAHLLTEFAACLRVRYFAAGEIVLPMGEGVPSVLYIVKSGHVVGERPGISGAAVPALELSPGEMFPIGAVLTERPTHSTFRAHHDTLVFEVPSAQFRAQLARLHALQDFCERRLFNLLERSRASLRAAYSAERLSEHPFSRPLRSAITRPPVTCTAAATLAEVLATMHREKVGAVILVNAQNCAEGILTERDVIGRVVLPGLPLTTPAMHVATAPVRTLDETQPISAAALLMVTHSFRHVVVTQNDAVVGVVSERSLFALQRQSLASVSDAIQSAADVPALARCGADIRDLSRALVAQGVAAGLLTQFISQLNDQLTQRLITLLMPSHPVTSRAGIRWCWLAFGSEGRHEQTISTDQDNGLIFLTDAGENESAVRDALLPFARAVNEALATCGFPLCKGNIMASNPTLCLTVQGWVDKFQSWIASGDPKAVLNANIFFDMRTLAGVGDLVAQVQHAVYPMVAQSARFRKQMAEQIAQLEPPLTWLGRIDASDAGTLDLKRMGAMPFTDAARFLALAHGVTATRTRDRLLAVREQMNLSQAEVLGWIEAFEFVQMLRLRHQHERLAAMEAGRPVSENANEVAVNTLSPLDDRILREAFRQARKLQQRIALDYR